MHVRRLGNSGRLEQLTENTTAVSVSLTRDELARLDAATSVVDDARSTGQEPTADRTDTRITRRRDSLWITVRWAALACRSARFVSAQ